MRWSFIGLLVLLVSACAQEKPLPPGVLTKTQMVEWMIPVYLAEARVQLLGVNRDSAYRLFVPLQDSLIRRHGYQDTTLMKSYQYYLDNSDQLEIIYDMVIDSLNLREQKLRQAIGN